MYVYMSFVLRYAAQMFQRFVDEVLLEVTFSFAYLYDVLIAIADHSRRVMLTAH